MKITPKQYAALLYEMTSDKDEAATKKFMKTFVELLARNRAISLLPRIVRAYAAHYNRQEDVLDVTVTSARELSHHALKSLREALQEQSVECVSKINPEVLGGARIRVGDYMIDDTLKGRLQMLKQFLIQ